MGKVLIFLVYYQSEVEIIQCVNDLQKQNIDFTLYVHLNSQIAPLTLEELKADNVIIGEYNGNLGFSKAVNIGFKYAIRNNYNFIFLVNPDIAIPKANVLDELIKTSAAFNNNAIISPIQLSKIKPDKLDHKFENYFTRAKIIPRSHCLEVSFVNAAFWLVSSEIIKKVGGFDTLFFLYGEDLNYAYRAINNGFKVIINPKVKILHSRHSKLESDKHHYFLNLKGYLWNTIITSEQNMPKTFFIAMTIILKKYYFESKYFKETSSVAAITFLKFFQLFFRRKLYYKNAFLK